VPDKRNFLQDRSMNWTSMSYTMLCLFEHSKNTGSGSQSWETKERMLIGRLEYRTLQNSHNEFIISMLWQFHNRSAESMIKKRNAERDD